MILTSAICCETPYPIIPWEKQIEVYKTVSEKFIEKYCADGNDTCREAQIIMLENYFSEQIILHKQLDYTKKDEDRLVRQLKKQFTYLGDNYFDLVRVKQASLILKYRENAEPDFGP